MPGENARFSALLANIVQGLSLWLLRATLPQQSQALKIKMRTEEQLTQEERVGHLMLAVVQIAAHENRELTYRFHAQGLMAYTRRNA